MARVDRGRELQAVLDANIPGAAKALLFALDSIRGNREELFPKMEWVAPRAGLSLSGAWRAMAELEARGAVSSDYRRGEHKCYRTINYDRLREMSLTDDSPPSTYTNGRCEHLSNGEMPTPAPIPSVDATSTEERCHLHLVEVASLKNGSGKEEARIEPRNQPRIELRGRGSAIPGWSGKDEEAIRTAYPLGGKPLAAVRAIRRVLTDGYSPDRLLADVREFAEATNGCQEKYLTTLDRWLDAGRHLETGKARAAWKTEARDGSAPAPTETVIQRMLRKDREEKERLASA